MSGSDFTLDINNPKEPKVLCVGNNPDRISIYGAALGLYNSRIVKLINKKKQLKSCVIIDELPTIFFKDVFIPFIKQFDCMRERTKLAAFIDF